MSGARWFIARNNEKVGPFSALDLKQLALAGLLKAADYVWLDGAKKWVAASSVPGLFAPAAVKEPEPTSPTPSRAELLRGSLEFEEAALYLAGKSGDALAKLIATLMNLKRTYANNPALVESLDANIAALQVKRVDGGMEVAKAARK